MSKCGLNSAEGRKILLRSLQTEIFKNDLTENLFIDIILNNFNNYSDEIEDFEQLVSSIARSPIMIRKHPWIAAYGDIEYLHMVINPRNAQSKEPDSEKGKLDIIEGQDLTDSSDIYLYQTYGSKSYALKDAKQRFEDILSDSIIFDYRTGLEVTSQEQLNENISYYLETLWRTIYENLPDLNLDERSIFLNKSELERVKKYFEGFNPVAINMLYQLSIHNKKSKKIFDAFLSYFILYNFDNLIKSFYGHLILIDPMRFGPDNLVNPILKMDNYFKYQVNFLNYNLETNWSSEEEVNDVVKEASDIIKLFFNTRMLLDRNGDIPLRRLDLREVTYIWGEIKSLQYKPQFKLPLNKTILKNMLGDGYLTQEEYDYLVQKTKNNLGIDDYFVHSIESLIQESRENGTFIIPLIYKLLSADPKYLLPEQSELKKRQKEIIYSTYKHAFSPESKLRRAWENRDISDFDNQPRSYYQFMTHFFNMLSHILMTQYEQDENGTFQVKTLGDSSLDRHILYYQDQINGKFLASIDQETDPENFAKKIKHFPGYVLDRTLLKGNGDNSFVLLKFDDNNTVLRIHPNLIVDVSKDGGKNYLSIENIDLENESALCQFIQYALNINTTRDDFISNILSFPNISESDLLTAACNVMYNYAVSCEVISDKETNSLESAKTKAKTYFFGDEENNIRQQRNEKELNSFSTKTITKTIKYLHEALDLMNGVLRQASAKGADGNTINSMSTAQLMDDLYALIYRGAKHGEKYLCIDFSSLQIAYEGEEVARDVKTSSGENKKCVLFTPAENGAFTFVYDFAAPLLDPDLNSDKTMRVMPCVISDKPRLLKIKINLDAEVNGKKIKDLSFEEIKELTKNELGGFYLKTFDSIEDQWNKLNAVSKGEVKIDRYKNSEDIKWFLEEAKKYDLFGLNQNFNGINAAIDKFISERMNLLINTHNSFLSGIAVAEDSIYETIKKSFIIEFAKRNIISYPEAQQILEPVLSSTQVFILSTQEIQNIEKNKTRKPTQLELFNIEINKYFIKKASQAVTNLLHALEIAQQSKVDENGKLVQDEVKIATAYSFVSPDKLHMNMNYALAEELHKWGIKDDVWLQFHLPETMEVLTNYKDSNDFFRKKNELFVLDFIQEGGNIPTHNSYGAQTPGVLQNLANFENKSWVRGGKITLAKINYSDYFFRKETEEEIDDEEVEESRINPQKNQSEEESDESENILDEEVVTPELRNYSLGITDLESLSKIGIVKYAFSNAKFYSRVEEFSKYKSIDLWLQSPTFSFDELIEIINEYYEVLDLERSNEEKANEILSKRIANINANTQYSDKGREKIIEKFTKHRDNVKKIPEKVNHNVNITVHPLIEKFNSLSYLFGQEYMNTAVGSYILHSGKNHKNVTIYASQAYGQQTKRNVILSATKHQMQLNELDGLPSDVKMAVIQNTKDIVYTVNGEEEETFDDDGAAYLTGVTSELENSSLKGSRVGIDKKDIFWSQDPITGQNKFIKCAVFASTNQRIRQRRFDRYLNYRGLKGVEAELTEFYKGTEHKSLDITKNYLDLNIKFGRIIYKRAWCGKKDADVSYLQFYDDSGNAIDVRSAYDGSIVQIEDIAFNEETGRTEFTVKNYTKNTIEKLSVELKNVHDIWLFFGGAYSMDLTENLLIGKEPFNERDYSDDSTKRTAFVVNSVGKVLYGTARNLKNVNQYLKKSMIHYFPTHEATKCGSTNQNPKHFLYDILKDLAYATENLLCAGPQLNAEHESDESVLSMMTLVVNALGSRGYTAEQANLVYKALRSLTLISLKGFINSITHSNLGNADEAKVALENFITDIIKRTITSGKTSSNPETLADLLYLQTLIAIEENKGKLTYNLIKLTLPIDNATLLRDIMSKISSTLVKTSIKLKAAGTMDVLSPSNGVFKLYDGRMLDYYEGGDTSELPNRPVLDLADIDMGVTYYAPGYWEGDIIKVKTPRDYYLLRKYVELSGIQLEEVVSEGRDLAGYNITFKDIDGNSYNIWDLDVVKSSYRNGFTKELREVLLEQLNALSNYHPKETVMINGKLVFIDQKSIKVHPYEIIMSRLYKKQFGLRNGDDVKTISENDLFFLGRSFESRVEATKDWYDVELSTIDGENKYLITDQVPRGFRKVHFNPVRDEEGRLWYLDYKNNPVEQLSSEEDEIYSNGKIRIIKTKNIEFYLNNIKHNRVNISSRIKNADKLLDILDQFEKSESKSAQFFVKKFNLFLKTNDVELELNYTADGEEKQVFGAVKDLLLEAKKINQATSKFQAFLKSYLKYEQKRINQILGILQNPNLSQKVKRTHLEMLAKKDFWLNYQLIKSKEIHTSFLKSLKVLAARIPAQCMQSFMSMKVVGFDESDLNTAYVSRFLIYLQGSDFDIDKVSLLGYKFKNGEFVKWSPYMNLLSEELLEASENLPFPTGEKVKIVDNNEYIDEIRKLSYDLIGVEDELYIEYSDSYEIVGLHDVSINNPDNIKKLARLINLIDLSGGIPSGLTLGERIKLEGIINYHNLYITKSHVDVTKCLLNYLSSTMYNIGKDSGNLIQAQQSVDSENGAVNLIKMLSASLNYSKKLNKTDVGTVTSNFLLLALCNGGKANTGITASSLKVYEAEFQYVCNILNHGTEEQKKNLLMGLEICGEDVQLIANAFLLIKTSLPLEVEQALRNVKQDVDAALLTSGFLSLSTDNAKDPTLPKINASENMIGLYLSGIALGLDIETLINLLTSETALKIASMMPSNLFTGEQGYKRVSQVLTYIHDGPRDMDIPLNKLLNDFKKLPKEFLENPTVRNLWRLKDEDWKTYKKVLESSNLSKTLLKNIRLREKEVRAWRKLKNITKFDTFRTSSGEVLPAYDQIQKLCFMLEEMNLFRQITKLNQGLPNSISKQLDWIRKFEGMLSQRVKVINKLQKNVSSEEMSEILSDLQEYNKKLMQAQNIPEDLIEANLNQVDFIEFVKNPEYQLIVINTYGKLKFGINIFEAAVTVPHYYGYMQAAAALFTTNQSLSATWALTNYLSKYYLNQISSDTATKEKTLSKTVDYINSSFIDEFLSKYDFGYGEGIIKVLKGDEDEIKVYNENASGRLELVGVTVNDLNILLGTYSGNMTYKYIFEQVVIPWLKQEYKNNRLIQSLNFIRTDKTLDRTTLIKLAPETKMIPENNYEEQCLAEYKQGLNNLKNVRIPQLGGIQFLDAIYLYNLIINQNQLKESSLTPLFEEHIYNQGKKTFESLSNFIQSFFDFLRTSPDYILSKINPFTIQLLNDFFIKIAPEDNNFKSKMPYIRKRNKTTGELVLLKYDRNKHRKDKRSLNSEDDNVLLDIIQQEYNEDSTNGYELDPDEVILEENDQGSRRESYFEKQVKNSMYEIISVVENNPMVYDNLSISNIKALLGKVEGKTIYYDKDRNIIAYKDIKWEDVSELEKVKLMGVNSLEELLISIGILSSDKKTILNNISSEDLMDNLKTVC